MKQKDMELYLMEGLFLCVVGIIAAKMFGWGIVSSLLFTMTFPLTVLLWGWSLRTGLTKKGRLTIITAGLAAVCVLIDLVWNRGSFSFSYIKKLIMFIMTLLFLQAADKVRLDERLPQFIQMPVDGLTILMMIMYILQHKEMYKINGIVSRYLTFGFSNPNLPGMFLACLYMLTFCALLKEKERKGRIFHGVMLAMQLFFILATQSRNGLLNILLFTIVALCVIFRRQISEKIKFTFELRIGRWPAVIIAVFPIVFAVIYMALINMEWVQSVFGFMVSEGKKLNSRVKEWKPAFEVIKNSPLIGSYYNLSGGTGTSQMHSTHVDTAASYGIPVMLLMSGLLAGYIHQEGKTYENKINFLYMAAFCCAMLMGIFEAAVFSGGLGIYVFSVIFLALSKTGAAYEN